MHDGRSSRIAGHAIRSSFDQISRIDVQYNDELGQLGRAFNQMAFTIFSQTESLREGEERLTSFMNSASDNFYILDSNLNFVELNKKALEHIGKKRADVIGKNIADIVPDVQQSGRYEKHLNVIKTGEPLVVEDFIPHPIFGNKHFVLTSFKVGDGLGVIAYDITERKQAEEQLKKSLVEKETLLRELYHRTKNNMSVIIALLELQCEYYDSELLRKAYKDAQNRIRFMALVHQKLYDASDLSHINLKDYINSLVALLLTGYTLSPGQVSFVSEMEDVFVLIDTAIPCGLILNELISNSLKHAFPDERKGEIKVRLCRSEDGEIQLGVCDTGVGLPDGFDFQRDGRMGLQTVFILAEQQLKAQICFSTEKGVLCSLRFRDNLYQPRV